MRAWRKKNLENRNWREVAQAAKRLADTLEYRDLQEKVNVCVSLYAQADSCVQELFPEEVEH